MNVLSNTLTADLKVMNDYLAYWHLRLSTAKTTVTSFHLNNSLAKVELQVSCQGKPVKHENYPRYLGVTLDRSLTYCEHLKRASGKIKSRNSIIQKLAGTSWGSNPSTLRTASLALVYSSAEYCSPVWAQSCHAKCIDTILKSTMRIISGTLKSTPVQWLPVLSHTQTPNILRMAKTLKQWNLCASKPDLPIHEDLTAVPTTRLKSRKPLWLNAKSLLQSGFDANAEWTKN